MARFLAFDAIFFLLPFAAYALWLVATRGSLTNIANWQARTIAILALGGAVLVLGSIVVFVHLGGAPPGGTYVPAHMEDGVIVPGHFVYE
jgi:hypothetical protein